MQYGIKKIDARDNEIESNLMVLKLLIETAQNTTAPKMTMYLNILFFREE